MRLLPAQYVKPYVKRSKNDRTDAAATCEAASRPGMSSVPVKSAKQQADAMILKHRELLVGQRTAAINALRGHATEFGVISAKGTAQVKPLLAKLAAEEGIPATARALFVRIGEHIDQLDQQVEAVEAELLAPYQGQPGQPVAGRHARHRPDHRHHVCPEGDSGIFRLPSALRRSGRA